MESSKFSSNKRDWLVNIIIGVRKEVLEKLRAMVDSLDREVYTMAQRNAISQEIREIAEMVSEKDAVMKRKEELEGIPDFSQIKEGSLVEITRSNIIKMLKEIRDGVYAIEYEGEYSIIDKELNEIESIVREKDRLIHTKVQGYYAGGIVNPHISKYFKIDGNQEL